MDLYNNIRIAILEGKGDFDEGEFRRREAEINHLKGKYLMTTDEHKGESGAGYVLGHNPKKAHHVLLSVHQGGGVRSKNQDHYKEISVHKDHLREPKMSDYKEDVNPYAVGMAQAEKSTGDTPPLKKSTIIKAHKIAKEIEAKEEIEQIEESKMKTLLDKHIDAGHDYDTALEKAKGEFNQPTSKEYETKDQVINHFVSQGKPAKQGAAAWERGWRGPKKPKLDEGFTIRSKGYGHVEVVKRGKVIKTFTNPQDARMHIAKISKKKED